MEIQFLFYPYLILVKKFVRRPRIVTIPVGGLGVTAAIRRRAR